MKIKIKDPGSALTHFIAMLGAGAAAVPLLLKAAREPDHIHFAALLIFIVSMILLYAASTIYHTLDISDEVNKRLRKLYTGVSDRSWRPVRVLPAGARLGNCDCRYYY